MKLPSIKELREIALKATPGNWGRNWSCNIPFYTVVDKPAPSLSKHDSERPTYWRYEDGKFVAAFSPDTVLELLYMLETATNALKVITSPTYGTEICNTEEENNEILAKHFFDHVNIACKTLQELELE